MVYILYCNSTGEVKPHSNLPSAPLLRSLAVRADKSHVGTSRFLHILGGNVPNRGKQEWDMLNISIDFPHRNLLLNGVDHVIEFFSFASQQFSTEFASIVICNTASRSKFWRSWQINLNVPSLAYCNSLEVSVLHEPSVTLFAAECSQLFSAWANQCYLIWFNLLIEDPSLGKFLLPKWDERKKMGSMGHLMSISVISSRDHHCMAVPTEVKNCKNQYWGQVSICLDGKRLT